MKESELREKIAVYGRSLFDRGYTCGSSGNISAKLEDGILLTPTNSCLGRIEPDRISQLDREGHLISGDRPSKEAGLHLAIYSVRPDAGAVVHLHSPHAVAVSCLAALDPQNVLPPITPYFVMRVGRLPLAPYFPPGDQRLAAAVGELARENDAILMARHGTVVSGRNLDAAVYTAEELEETARLFMLLQNCRYQALSEDQVAELKRRFGN